jgi:hypothetical protein
VQLAAAARSPRFAKLPAAPVNQGGRTRAVLAQNEGRRDGTPRKGGRLRAAQAQGSLISMPVLDDLPQLHTPEIGPYLAAAIFFPRDSERRRRFVSAVKNTYTKPVIERHRPAQLPDCTHGGDAMDPLTGDHLAAFIAREDGGRLLAKTEGGYYPRHAMAGLLLVHVLAQGPRGTLVKAIAVLETGGGTERAEPVSGRGHSSLMQCWNDFMPAAHLAAAMLFLPDLWQSGQRRDVARLLAYAEALRQRGENCRAPRSGHPLLDPGKTLTFPGWLVLPDIPPLSLSLDATTAPRSAWR